MSADHDHKWKHDGVRVIPGNSLDGNTPQTAGMDRKAAINFALASARRRSGPARSRSSPMQRPARITMARSKA